MEMCVCFCSRQLRSSATSHKERKEGEGKRREGGIITFKKLPRSRNAVYSVAIPGAADAALRKERSSVSSDPEGSARVVVLAELRPCLTLRQACLLHW